MSINWITLITVKLLPIETINLTMSRIKEKPNPLRITVRLKRYALLDNKRLNYQSLMDTGITKEKLINIRNQWGLFTAPLGIYGGFISREEKKSSNPKDGITSNTRKRVTDFLVDCGINEERISFRRRYFVFVNESLAWDASVPAQVETQKNTGYKTLIEANEKAQEYYRYYIRLTSPTASFQGNDVFLELRENEDEAPQVYSTIRKAHKTLKRKRGN